MNRVSCSVQGDYSFSRCLFFGNPNNPITGSGGAIYLSNNQATLTVESCQFHLLAVTNSGGAIYTNYLSNVNITDSFFNGCRAPVSQVGGVGAVFIIQCSQPLVQNCLFTSCICSLDGGAVYFGDCSCSWHNGIAAQNSQFLSCKCTGENYRSDISDGGGIMTWGNTHLIGVRNCLFFNCHCYKGGGIYLYIPSSRDLTPIQFCFLNKNTGTYGNDVFVNFAFSLGWTKIFLHSFTTGSPSILGENSGSPRHVANNWLPLTIRTVELSCCKTNRHLGVSLLWSHI